MSPRGRFRQLGRERSFEALLDPAVRSARRVRRIVRSLRDEIVDAGSDGLRIRRVFTNPREIYRVELERPGLAYQRTTLLDRAALEELLAQEEVRSRLRGSPLTARSGVPGAGVEPARPVARRF